MDLQNKTHLLVTASLKHGFDILIYSSYLHCNKPLPYIHSANVTKVDTNRKGEFLKILVYYVTCEQRPGSGAESLLLDQNVMQYECTSTFSEGNKRRHTLGERMYR